jgi:hypothetical protein
MIICDVCSKNPKLPVCVVRGRRHIFPVRRIDACGPHDVNDVFSVDLCEVHARVFWGDFIDLIEKYSAEKEAVEALLGQTSEIKAPDAEAAVPQVEAKDWRPEPGKHYGKSGNTTVYVDHIDKKGKVRFRDDKGNVSALHLTDFAKFYGMTPIKKG